MPPVAMRLHTLTTPEPRIGRAFVVWEVAMLDEPITIRDMLTLIHLVRDEKARDPLRRLEDVLLDLHAKASV